MYTAEVAQSDAFTRLDWVVDSDFRFFPTVPDETFGYMLHPVDLAMNKAMAAAGRSEVRDLVDLVTIHETVLSLGAVIWAAVEKAPGVTPEGLIAEIRRNSNYPAADWRTVEQRANRPQGHHLAVALRTQRSRSIRQPHADRQNRPPVLEGWPSRAA
jgi:hypothetical protein